MTYTYTLEGIFESVPETKRLAVDRPCGTFSKAEWIKFASDFCERVNAPEPSDNAEADDNVKSPSMKLVDILARELKVWPEGIECLSQLKVTGYIINGKGFDGRSFDALQIADETLVAGAIVTRFEWQAAVDALNADRVEYSPKPEKAEKSADHKECPEFLKSRIESLEAELAQAHEKMKSQTSQVELESRIEDLEKRNKALSEVTVWIDDRGISTLSRAQDGDGLYFTNQEDGIKVIVQRKVK